MKKTILAAIFAALAAITAYGQTAKSETANPGTQPTTAQCQAKTQAGNQCRNKAKTLGLCGLHSAMADTSQQCGRPTKKGKPCKMRTGGKPCRHHAGN